MNFLIQPKTVNLGHSVNSLFVSTKLPVFFHILLIEDEDGDAMAIEEKLRSSELRPFQLERASTLAEGIQTLRETSEINIVLLDLHLEDSGGLETFDTLHKAFPHLPIIVLTGVLDNKMGMRAVEMGAQNFLEKNHITPHLIDSSIRFAIARNLTSHRMEQAITSARIAQWELDPVTYKMKWSSAIHELLQTNETENYLGTLNRFLEKVHSEDRDTVEESLMRVVHTGKPEDHYIRLLNEERFTVFVSFHAEKTINPIDASHVVVGMVQDMTDRERMEFLKQEKELANKAARLRQDFLARTSHEIRTPLNPILVLTKLLLDTNLDHHQKEYLEAINAAGKTLLAVVNDILDLSKIEAGKIDFTEEPFNVRKVMEQVEDMMTSSASEKGIAFRMKIDPRLCGSMLGDSVRLSQILLNLLSNAIKFTRQGEVGVHATMIGQNQHKVKIQFDVFDSGIGIPEDELDFIFDSFWQVRSHTRQSGGTGLGLTIVKKLVELQQGKIQVESELGKGSTFTFTLEYKKGTCPEADADFSNELSQLSGKRILLAEDNPLNQLVTKKLITDWGASIDIASHGREAIDKLRSGSYDLVLMDLQMPEMNGLEATRVIRSTSGLNLQIPIIAMTANAFSGANDECIQAGMNDYVPKPIEITNLYRKIVHYLTPNTDTNIHVSESASTAPDETESFPTFEQMAKITEVDLSYLREVSNGDADIMRMAIDKYLETTPAYLENLQVQLKGLDYEELRKAAHKLKSSLQFMGLTQLHQLALMIETSCKSEQNMDQLPIWVNQISEGIEDSYPLLKEARDAL